MKLTIVLGFLFSFSLLKAQPTEEVWNEVRPYLLPNDHPVKPKLDQIFSKSRAILNIKSMQESGFIKPKIRKWTKLVVTKHPELPGCVIKTYLDAQRYPKNQPEHYYWLLRIKGAQAIQKEINRKGYHHFFKVPKKWIYPLPEYPKPPNEYLQKYFILIEEDMSIYKSERNEIAWKSSLVTEELLVALYHLLETLGLKDCSKIDNIPFSKDGRIAFIDTQTHGQWPIPYSLLESSLPSHLKEFWTILTTQTNYNFDL